MIACIDILSFSVAFRILKLSPSEVHIGFSSGSGFEKYLVKILKKKGISVLFVNKKLSAYYVQRNVIFDQLIEKLDHKKFSSFHQSFFIENGFLFSGYSNTILLWAYFLDLKGKKKFIFHRRSKFCDKLKCFLKGSSLHHASPLLFDIQASTDLIDIYCIRSKLWLSKNLFLIIMKSVFSVFFMYHFRRGVSISFIGKKFPGAYFTKFLDSRNECVDIHNLEWSDKYKFYKLDWNWIFNRKLSIFSKIIEAFGDLHDFPPEYIFRYISCFIEAKNLEYGLVKAQPKYVFSGYESPVISLAFLFLKEKKINTISGSLSYGFIGSKYEFSHFKKYSDVILVWDERHRDMYVRNNNDLVECRVFGAPYTIDKSGAALSFEKFQRLVVFDNTTADDLYHGPLEMRDFILNLYEVSRRLGLEFVVIKKKADVNYAFLYSDQQIGPLSDPFVLLRSNDIICCYGLTTPFIIAKYMGLSTFVYSPDELWSARFVSYDPDILCADLTQSGNLLLDYVQQKSERL